MLYFYQSEEMHFYLRTYLLTCYIVGLFSSLFSYVFIRYQFHIYGDIVIFHRKFLQNHTQKTAYILAGNTYYNLSGRSRNWMNWIDFILKTYGAFKFLTQINIIRKKIYIYIYIYILYIYYIYIIYVYIYIYIYIHRHVFRPAQDSLVWLGLPNREWLICQRVQSTRCWA